MEKAIKRYSPVFVLPTLLAFMIGFIIPFIQGLYLSFCQFTTVNNATFTGLSNYQSALADSSFLSSFKFTVMFAVASIVLINVIAFALALLLTRQLKGTNVFRTIFFMPNLIGGIVLGYIWQILINCILSIVGQPLLALNSSAGYWGLIILMCWQQIGYMMIIYIAGLQNVSDDLIEAAAIDGAGKWKQLIHVSIPGIAPVISIQLLLTVGKLLTVGYEKILLLYTGATYSTADVISTYVYRRGLMEANYSYGSAVSIFQAVMALILVVLANKAARKVGQTSLW